MFCFLARNLSVGSTRRAYLPVRLRLRGVRAIRRIALRLRIRTFPFHLRHRLVRCLLVGEVTRDDFSAWKVHRGRCSSPPRPRQSGTPSAFVFSERSIRIKTNGRAFDCAALNGLSGTFVRVSWERKKVIARFILYPRVYGENTARKTRVSTRTQFTKNDFFFDAF